MRHIVSAVFAALIVALPAQAQTLDRIKETGVIRLGFRTDAAPLSYADGEGRPAGYTPMLCLAVTQALANALQTELEAIFYPVDATNRFDKVAAGEIDILCGAASITMRRREKVDFTDPIFVDGISYLVRAEDEAARLADFAGKTVGVRAGTTTEEAVGNSIRAAGIDAKIVTFPDHNAGLAAMEAGDIGAYFADQSILYSLQHGAGDKAAFRVAPEILTVEKHGLALPRNDADFRGMVDTALSVLYSSNAVEQILNDAMPGVRPGLALRAMFLIGPTLP